MIDVSEVAGVNQTFICECNSPARPSVQHPSRTVTRLLHQVEREKCG